MQNIPDILRPLELIHIDIGSTLSEMLENTPHSTANPKYNRDNINISKQEGRNLCWAAVTQAILRLYGDNKTQCEIAKMELFSNNCSENCCDSDTQTTFRKCDQHWQLSQSLFDFKLLALPPSNPPLSANTIRTEIKKNLPVCFEIEWAVEMGGGRHVAIISDCSGDDASLSPTIYCSLYHGRHIGKLVGNQIFYNGKWGTWTQVFLTKRLERPVA